MTTEQAQRFAEITELVTVAYQMLQQAYAATYTRDMLSVIPVTTRTAIMDAHNAAKDAAQKVKTGGGA